MARERPETMEVKIGKSKMTAVILGEEDGKLRVQIPSGTSMLVDKPEAPKTEKADTSTKKDETPKPLGEEAAK